MDFYELTMAQGYFKSGNENTVAVFDMFYRSVPDKGGYSIFAGLEQLVKIIENFTFTAEDLAYLRCTATFDEDFLTYLKNFKFTCDVWSVKEGTVIFPGEPVLTVCGPIIEVQLIETILLLTINHQSLIATKTSRIVRAADGRPVMEFGSRRAHGYDAAVYGARAAYIGGCSSTACTLAGKAFGIPAVGTMAHSWVQMFENEYEAFKTYAQNYPDKCTILIDTYDTLRSGLPNAIKAFNEVVLPAGFRPKGVRIDSGDLAYLSKQVRKGLDEAGFSDVDILASNSLDEYVIRNLITQGAQISSFGVGENLITSHSAPTFGGVYKLAAVKSANGEFVPKIKISESLEKITTPGFKKLYRFYEKNSGLAFADYIALHDETVDLENEELTIFDPAAPWKKQTIGVGEAFAKELLVKVFENGKLVYNLPEIEEIRSFCAAEQATLWEEVKRFEVPHKYYVDLSLKLWELKNELIMQNS